MVLFGSGDGGPRTLGTTLVEDLASRGYLVVTVDHTYEADQVEFPGRRLARALPLPAKLTPKVIAKLLAKHARARLADMRYVLDQVTALAHGSFTDLQPLLPQIAAKLPKVPLADYVGTIDPGRSVAAQRAYVGAFFDLHLRGRPTHLFDGPDTRFPEVSLIP
ncbi:hypothetical protein [Microtetraspora fusca]|uniref:hypothetical protein n=1 Tax=Microtetraspora fusca TaxID=1997 RepID=UPI00082FE54B